MSRVRALAGLGVLAIVCSGCSIAGLEPPRSAQPGQPQPWRRTCRQVPLLLVSDLAVATNGVLWATDTLYGNDFGKVQHVTGWVTAGVFGGSAIYGLYVAIACQSLASQAAPRESAAVQPVPVKRSGFPDSVMQFRFGSSAAQASQSCAGAGGTFEAQGGLSLCRSPAPSMARPNVQLEFRLGELSRISLLYPAPAEQLRPSFEKVLSQAELYYGSPQSGPAPWSPTCTGASASQCLQAGERPGRTVWTWSLGEIELVPSIASDSTLVELRYTRYDHSGE